MGWSSIKRVGTGSVNSWTLRAAAEQKWFNGKVLHYCQHLQALPSFPACTAAIRHISLPREPLLGVQVPERSTGGLSQVPKVAVLSNVMFTGTSPGELVSLLGYSSHLQTQLLFPSFFLSSCPLCHIMQAVGLLASIIVLYLFQYVIFHLLFFLTVPCYTLRNQ